MGIDLVKRYSKIDGKIIFTHIDIVNSENKELLATKPIEIFIGIEQGQEYEGR